MTDTHTRRMAYDVARRRWPGYTLKVVEARPVHTRHGWRVEVVCPWCGGTHLHGLPDHDRPTRVPHCHTSGGGEYLLRLPDGWKAHVSATVDSAPRPVVLAHVRGLATDHGGGVDVWSQHRMYDHLEVFIDPSVYRPAEAARELRRLANTIEHDPEYQRCFKAALNARGLYDDSSDDSSDEDDIPFVNPRPERGRVERCVDDF